jgi:hypothetical protein
MKNEIALSIYYMHHTKKQMTTKIKDQNALKHPLKQPMDNQYGSM